MTAKQARPPSSWPAAGRASSSLQSSGCSHHKFRAAASVLLLQANTTAGRGGAPSALAAARARDASTSPSSALHRTAAHRPVLLCRPFAAPNAAKTPAGGPRPEGESHLDEPTAETWTAVPPVKAPPPSLAAMQAAGRLLQTQGPVRRPASDSDTESVDPTSQAGAGRGGKASVNGSTAVSGIVEGMRPIQEPGQAAAPYMVEAGSNGAQVQQVAPQRAVCLEHTHFRLVQHYFRLGPISTLVDTPCLPCIV